MVKLIGFIAAILTTGCYIPQAWHVVKERNTGGISLLAYVTLFTGIALWFVYGIMMDDMPLILANGLTLPLLAIVIAMKLRHK